MESGKVHEVVNVWKGFIKEYNKLRTKPNPRDDCAKLNVGYSKSNHSIKCNNEPAKANYVKTMVEEWLQNNEQYRITRHYQRILNDENSDCNDEDFLRTFRIENLKQVHSKLKLNHKDPDPHKATANHRSTVAICSRKNYCNTRNENEIGVARKSHTLNMFTPPELKVSYINPIPWSK